MFAGVVGCKAGWLAALGDWPGGEPLLAVCRDFRGVLTLTGACAGVAVAAPLGLSCGPFRLCDEAARAKLGAAKSVHTPAPPRPCLAATTVSQFQKLHEELTGRRAAAPGWALLARAREVDAAVTPELQRRVVEFCPLLAWRRLAGDNKFPAEWDAPGLRARRELLTLLGVAGVNGLAGWHKKQARGVAEGNILDALVGMAVACDLSAEAAATRRLPGGEPPADARGLRMEMWF